MRDTQLQSTCPRNALPWLTGGSIINPYMLLLNTTSTKCSLQFALQIPNYILLYTCIFVGQTIDQISLISIQQKKKKKISLISNQESLVLLIS